MGEIDNEPIVSEADFYPEADVFSIWVSSKTRPSTRDGKPITVQYWEGCWDIPEAARAADDRRKRPQVTASSSSSPEDAEEKCRQKVLNFWLDRSDGVRQETYQNRTAVLTKEQRRAAYTVQSFLEEWVASRTNPNTRPENRWADNTARRNQSMLEMWIYPYLGETRLTALTHEQVRIHFTETLPNVLDDKDQRRLGDKRIRNIYSVFKTGMLRAGAKGLLEEGEFLAVGIQMSFEPAGMPEDIDHLMWEMNALLQRPEVIADPLALRWALAYGQALRRGERTGLKWSDVNLVTGQMKVQRQMNYVPGRGDFLDERLKANEARTIEITAITRPFLVVALERRKALEQTGNWNPREDLAELVLLRDDGTAEKLNHDNELFHAFMAKYEIHYRDLSPGSLRHACATYFANYGGPNGSGVERPMLRKFMGHSAGSNLDAYYARASQIAMSREFGNVPVERPNQVRT